MNDTSPELDLPRYSSRMLPSYRHLPFQNAHPFMDKDGHSYGEKLVPPATFGSEGWQNCDDYLYSIDLFNHGFWWEAHERLKQISFGAGRESECGVFIQGLIQIAARLLKYSMNEHAPAQTLITLGLGNLKAAQNPYLGIDAEVLSSSVQSCLNGKGAYPRVILIKSSHEEH